MGLVRIPLRSSQRGSKKSLVHILFTVKCLPWWLHQHKSSFPVTNKPPYCYCLHLQSAVTWRWTQTLPTLTSAFQRGTGRSAPATSPSTIRNIWRDSVAGLRFWLGRPSPRAVTGRWSGAAVVGLVLEFLIKGLTDMVGAQTENWAAIPNRGVWTFLMAIVHFSTIKPSWRSRLLFQPG